jgi:hypothetical protein
MKLVAFPPGILVGKLSQTACLPGYLWEFRHDTVGIYKRVMRFSARMEPPFTEWQWKNPGVKRFLQVPEYPCSLCWAKAGLAHFRVIYYPVLSVAAQGRCCWGNASQLQAFSKKV